MHQGKYVFAQIVDVISRYQFNQCVDRYHGAYRVQQLTCWEQFLALTFGHLSCRNSLRDIVICLSAHHQKLYHLGFRSLVRKSTLADANEHRDWRIYQDFSALLIAQARQLYMHDRQENVDIVRPSMPSTPPSLPCVSVCFHGRVSRITTLPLKSVLGWSYMVKSLHSLVFLEAPVPMCCSWTLLPTR